MGLSSPTQYGTDCVIMLHMDGADASTTFTDVSAVASSWTPAGNAQIDTAQSVFGGASGLFDGTGDYIETGDVASLEPGASDFTIDFRIRLNTVTASGVYAHQNTGDRGFEIQVTGAIIRFTYSTDGTTAINLDATWTPLQGTWYHIAIVRTSTTLKVFLDGVSIDSGLSISGTIFDSTTTHRIGERIISTTALDGWLDEFRFVIGQAIWTSNFTPPSAAYTSALQSSFIPTLALMGVG